MAINMHTAGDKADWTLVPSEQWNTWQRIAATTGGVVTPANAVSLTGALLVVAGFLQFEQGVTLPGVALIAIGRLADIIDGYIAHRTGTKSPLGEIIDTTLDKSTIFFGLVFIIAFNLLPAVFTAAIVAQSILNSVASLIGHKRGTVLHPTPYGKLATFLAWFTIVSYLFHSLLEKQGGITVLSGTVSALSYISFILFVLLAIQSTASYISQLHNFRPRKVGK